MGTPEFSANVLEGLVKAGYNVVLSVSQPDKPVGRKHVITPPPAKIKALELGFEVYQPDSLRNDEALDKIRSVNPDLLITAAYGKILPQSMLDIPKYGCINVHASLLPKYRGAAPVQYSILNGDDVTGVTIMKMDAGMDTGDILRQVEVPIDIDDTTESLMNKLANSGRDLLLDTIDDYVDGKITPIVQDENRVVLSPPITQDMALIDWNLSAREIHDKIRALSGWPGASTILDGKRVKIYASRIAESADSNNPGEITVARKGNLKVSCKDGAIFILELQLEGGKRLKAIDCAHNYKVGTSFGA